MFPFKIFKSDHLSLCESHSEPLSPFILQAAPIQKRERKPLAIVNPDTHETVNKEALGQTSGSVASDSASNTSTPPPAAGDRPTPDTQANTESSSSATSHVSIILCVSGKVE